MIIKQEGLYERGNLRGSLEEENLRSARGNAGLIASYGATESGVTRLKEPVFDMNRVWRLLEGAIDIHIHSGPCANAARSYDELEMAMQACQARIESGGLQVRFNAQRTLGLYSSEGGQPVGRRA